ncbi:hypothetical protein S40288_05771 [Stachybotrys chartarum IBT 40288]|nr:hypothetical protein S40288_05771 [Stachybotrys chartarum IBT 40288]
MDPVHSDKKILDVIVVGAGVVGASIAWHLAHQENVAVTIIASDVGGTATPKSFAWLNASWHNPKFYYDLRRRSMARWKQLADAVPGLQNVVQWCGSLEWDLPAEDLAKYERGHSGWGYNISRASRKEIAEYEPWLTDNALPEWGLRITEEGSVEAADAATLMVNHAQAHGARVISTTVANILKDRDCVTGVVDASGEQYLADHVVLAAGLGSVQLCASVSIDLPVTGKPGLLIHSKPVAQRLLKGIVLSDKVHMRQAVDGRLLAYPKADDSDPGENAQATAEETFAAVKSMFRGEANDVELDFFTVGDRPTPRDGLPILGASGLEGLSLAVMHSGVTLAAIVGEVLTNKIVKGINDPALPAFTIGRFKHSATVAGKLPAADL